MQELSDKLKALLSLTSTPNNVLAKAINVDSAQISRLRTGARKMPRDKMLLRNIADYLAARLESDYMVLALYDLTKDVRLQTATDKSIISDVLFDWMTYIGPARNSQVGQLLNRFNDFSNSEIDAKVPPATPNTASNRAFNRTYLGNKGKRQAILDLYAYIKTVTKPGVVKLFTDEIDDWLLENRDYMYNIGEIIEMLSARGFRIQRVLPPSQNIESVFTDIERWIPAYMAGNVRLYSYPRMRDELHRKTIYVVPGKIALYSMSLYGQRESQLTVMTTDALTIASMGNYFDCIMERCTPIINVYTQADANKVMGCIRDISMQTDNGVYKCSKLSAHTLPTNALLSMKKRASPYVSKVLETYAQNENFKFNVLTQFVITDIMSLPNLDRVINGFEPVPGTTAGKNTLYYTIEEYLLHLEHIVWYLEAYPNYRAVLLDDPGLNNIVIYTKGDARALMIKEVDPFALFEITDRKFAASLAEYLRNMVYEQTRPGYRRKTIDRINREITTLKNMLK